MANRDAVARFEARRAKTLEQIRRRKAERLSAARSVAASERSKRIAASLAADSCGRPSGEGVYALRETGTNMVKIGCTENFRKRYPSLRRTDNPRELLFMGWLSRDLSDEITFHHRFERFAVTGGGTEWFNMSAEGIAELESLLLLTNRPRGV